MAANSQCLVAHLSVEVFDKDLLLEFAATSLWIGKTGWIGISIQSSGTDTILINLFIEIEGGNMCFVVQVCPLSI